MLLFSAVCSADCSGCTQTFYLDTRESHDKVHCKSDQYLAFGYIELFRQGIFWINSAFNPLGTLWSHFAEHWEYARLFAHWVYWSQMAGHIQNVLSMCPLGISGSHNRVYLKCTQHLITGHIRVTCWLWSQCYHHVPSGYLGPCPQCLLLLAVETRPIPQNGCHSVFEIILLSFRHPPHILTRSSRTLCQLHLVPSGMRLNLRTTRGTKDATILVFVDVSAETRVFQMC